MIEWIKSAKMNNCTIDELKRYFKKYPISHKKVLRICDNCQDGLDVYFYAVTDLCHKCSSQTPKIREAARLKTVEQFSDPTMRDAARLRSIEQWSHQESRDKASKSATRRWSDQNNRDNASEIGKNSDAVRLVADKHRGRNDICYHHVAYDFLRPEALRIKITRKFHSSIHHPKGIQFHQRGYSLID